MPTGLNLLLATLPPGRRRVAMALLADPAGRTYQAVAAQLGVRLGTVHQHLRRIRQRHPEVHAAGHKGAATATGGTASQGARESQSPQPALA